jgi:hypothetical protein
MTLEENAGTDADSPRRNIGTPLARAASWMRKLCFEPWRRFEQYCLKGRVRSSSIALGKYRLGPRTELRSQI